MCATSASRSLRRSTVPVFPTLEQTPRALPDDYDPSACPGEREERIRDLVAGEFKGKLHGGGVSAIAAATAAVDRRH